MVLIAKAGIYRYDRKCQTYHEWPIESKYFSEVATGDETISTDVDTGRKASSGTSGTVFVSGTAVALNALANGGQFSISYDITIP